MPGRSRERRRVRVVEDEAIDAMCLEVVPRGAKWEVVGPVGRADAVLGLAGWEPLDAALLDRRWLPPQPFGGPTSSCWPAVDQPPTPGSPVRRVRKRRMLGDSTREYP